MCITCINKPTLSAWAADPIDPAPSTQRCDAMAPAPPPQRRGLWRRPTKRDDWAPSSIFFGAVHPTCLGCSVQVMGYIWIHVSYCILLAIICSLFNTASASELCGRRLDALKTLGGLKPNRQGEQPSSELAILGFDQQKIAKHNYSGFPTHFCW